GDGGRMIALQLPNRGGRCGSRRENLLLRPLRAHGRQNSFEGSRLRAAAALEQGWLRAESLFSVTAPWRICEMTHPAISTEDSSYRKRVSIGDTNMAYVDVGEGDPIVFYVGPGGFLIGAQREFCRAWPNQQEITVNGAHFF